MSCEYDTPKRLLSEGMTGEDVKWLQWQLCKSNHRVAIDGVFGILTFTALIAFQGMNDIPKTGIVDSTTRRLLTNQ